jgi:hypothetical protein
VVILAKGEDDMTQIELTTDEQLLLAQVLERRIRDMEVEILHTDHADFKAQLKTRIGMLRRVLDRLTHPAVAAAA